VTPGALAPATREAVDGHWAESFGVAPEGLRPLRPTVLASPPAFGDYHGAYMQSFGAAPLALLPSAMVDRYGRALAAALEEGLAADGRWRDVFGDAAGEVIGPAEVRYADALTFRPASGDGTARLLGPGDAAAVEALKDACDPVEWEHGGSGLGVHPVAGVWRGGVLVALAGYHLWNRAIAPIAIVTHPLHRGRGHGAAAVSAITSEILARGLIPQYRTLASNTPSLGVAGRLGFVPYATSLAVRFR
jgi:GNAT superfamily N-acetyltransferase